MDNDFQNQNLHLAGEANSKIPPVLQPNYALSKFDFDPHLRFESLVDEAGEGNEEDFSRGSSGIVFSSGANESRLRSSESVEMLLNSVGQDEENTIKKSVCTMKQKELCHTFHEKEKGLSNEETENLQPNNPPVDDTPGETDTAQESVLLKDDSPTATVEAAYAYDHDKIGTEMRTDGPLDETNAQTRMDVDCATALDKIGTETTMTDLLLDQTEEDEANAQSNDCGDGTVHSSTLVTCTGELNNHKTFLPETFNDENDISDHIVSAPKMENNQDETAKPDLKEIELYDVTILERALSTLEVDGHMKIKAMLPPEVVVTDTTRAISRKVNYSSSSSVYYHGEYEHGDDDDGDGDDDDGDGDDDDGDSDGDESDDGNFTSSDDEEYEFEPHPILMRTPRRSPILDLLSVDTQQQLKQFSSDVISRRFVRACLGRERYGFVMNTDPVGLRICDTLGKLYICWGTAGPSRWFLTPRKTKRIFERAVGFVRNQDKHELCWAYLICDLISSYRVLHGLDKKFKPLCPMYLCEKVCPEQYNRELAPGERHRCYSFNLQDGLMFVKREGIPRERNKDFDCRQRRRNGRDENHYGIEKVYKYNTLEEALTRLKTHPVGAGLVCFQGWLDQEVYRGPMKYGSAEYEGEHSVLMTECLEHNGEMVVKCKSSTGEEHGFKGYILVSLEVMLILAGAQRKRNTSEADKTCHIHPQYLLTDFYSVEMDIDPSAALIQETPGDKEFNRGFEVTDDARDGNRYAPRGELSVVKDRKKKGFWNNHKQEEKRTLERVVESDGNGDSDEDDVVDDTLTKAIHEVEIKSELKASTSGIMMKSKQDQFVAAYANQKGMSSSCSRSMYAAVSHFTTNPSLGEEKQSG